MLCRFLESPTPSTHTHSFSITNSVIRRMIRAHFGAVSATYPKTMVIYQNQNGRRKREKIRTKITDNIEHETNTNHKIYSIEREVHGMVKMSLQVRYKKWTHQEVVFVLASRSRASLLFDNDRTKNVRYIRNDLNKLYCHKALWKLEAEAAQFFSGNFIHILNLCERERERTKGRANDCGYCEIPLSSTWLHYGLLCRFVLEWMVLHQQELVHQSKIYLLASLQWFLFHDARFFPFIREPMHKYLNI